MIGYGLSAYCVESHDPEKEKNVIAYFHSWRLAFFEIAVIMGICIIVLILIPSDLIDIEKVRKVKKELQEEKGIPTDTKKSNLTQF